MLDHAIDGIVVCDLCESETIEEREDIFNTILTRIAQEESREKSYFFGKKLKLCLAGLGKIEDIEHAMKFGFSIFEVNYPFKLAEEQKILTLQDGKYLAREPVRKEELMPLQEGCECHTCQNHSEAYVFHLK